MLPKDDQWFHNQWSLQYRLSLVNQADGFLVGGGLGMRIIVINSLSYQLIPKGHVCFLSSFVILFLERHTSGQVLVYLDWSHNVSLLQPQVHSEQGSCLASFLGLPCFSSSVAFRLYWTQTEELKRERPGIEARSCWHPIYSIWLTHSLWTTHHQLWSSGSSIWLWTKKLRLEFHQLLFRYVFCSLVPRPRPAFRCLQFRFFICARGEPGNEATFSIFLLLLGDQLQELNRLGGKIFVPHLVCP